MKNIVVIFCLLGLSLGVFSCGGGLSNNETTTEPKGQKENTSTKNENTLKTINTKITEIGKKYTVKGLFKASKGLFMVKNGKISMGFYSGNEGVTVGEVNFGENIANAMWFPDDFTEDQIKIFDKNKVEGNMNDMYNVTFRVDASKLEEAPTSDITGILTKQYEERKAKNELKILNDITLIEFEKVKD